MNSDTKEKTTAFDWENFGDRYSVLKELYTNRKFTDIVLVTDDGGFEPTHLAVISVLGEQFNQLINNQLSNPLTPQVSVPGDYGILKVVQVPFSCQVLKAIHKCTYTGDLDEDDPFLIYQVFETAERFQMRQIIECCCPYLISHLTLQNVFQMLQVGIKYNNELETKSWSLIRNNFSVLYKHEGLSTLNLDQMRTLLSDDEINVTNEEIIWYAIRNWTCKQPNRQINLMTLIKYFRHGRVSHTFLAMQLANDDLIHNTPYGQRLISQMLKQNRDALDKKRRDGYGLPCGSTPEYIRPRVPNEIIFAIGGWKDGVPSTVVETYDLRTNRWFELKKPGGFHRAYHRIEFLNGFIYVVGGTNTNRNNSSEMLSSVHALDPTTGIWHHRANMYERRCFVSTAVHEGILYAMGGHNGIQRVQTVERYDSKFNQWTRCNKMHFSRSDASATVHNGLIFIAGGINEQTVESSAEFYDPKTEIWTLIKPMNSPRSSLSLVAFNNALYAIGGNNGFERLATCEKYDFESQTWTYVANMSTRRSTFSATVVENQIFVVGGYNGNHPINHVEKFDGIVNEWRAVEALKYDRSGLSVCVARDLINAKHYTFIGNHSKNQNHYTQLAANFFNRRRTGDNRTNNTPPQ